MHKFYLVFTCVLLSAVRAHSSRMWLTAESSCMIPLHTISSRVHYTEADAREIEKWLADSNLTNIIDFAQRLVGRPYVAHTLEVTDSEQVVVNLRGLDCATFVETAVALALTQQQGGKNFEMFCQQLERLRYRDGKCTDYLSRLHYLTFWIDDHQKRGNITEVRIPPKLTQEKKIRLNYMSKHSSTYRILSLHPQWVELIAEKEQQYDNVAFRYIPKRILKTHNGALRAIRDGDIIMIVTQKTGLDYSHQGIAYWGRDGHLRMLHASSDFKQVIKDQRTLYDYLQRIPHTLGIRVFRISQTL